MGKKQIPLIVTTKRNFSVFKTTTTLPKSWVDPSKSVQPSDRCENPNIPSCSLPYGVASNVHDPSSCQSLRNTIRRPAVAMTDRIHHAEGYILAFAAENSIPLSTVPKLIEFAKVLSRDTNALSEVKMDRTSAAYKMKYGLAFRKHLKVVEKLKSNFFSINIDECTSSSGNKRVFSILVSFFDTDIGESVVHHYNSVDCITVNAKVLFEKISKMFSDDGIPWENLVSDLSDSANYMRGKKNGLEKLIRDKTPHLLDIDGDTCHHVHNTVKKFCVPFEKFVEGLLDDIHNDTKFSAGIKQPLKEICFILNISFRTPPQRVPHRWLSAYDCTCPLIEMLDAYVVLYYSWLENDMKNVYEDDLKEIYDKYSLNEAAITSMQKKRMVLEAKSLTKDGLNRKHRIISKLFYERKKLELISHTYLAILPLFKSFALIFQQKVPLVHKLHDKMVETLKTFLCLFMKIEKVKPLSAKNLKKSDVKSFVRQPETFYFGDILEKMIRSWINLPSSREIVKDFLANLKTAYIEAGVYLQGKYAIDNELLSCLSAVDPIVRGHSSTYQMLIKLKPFFEFCLSKDGQCDYSLEITKYQLDTDLPDGSVDGRLDHWWCPVFKSGKYPLLSQIVKCALSIFTGPHIESSFSMMNDIIDPRASVMHVDTYAAIMSVKYDLKASKKTVRESYFRKNVIRDPIDVQTCYYIRTARSRYVKSLEEEREKRKEQSNQLHSTQQKARQKEKEKRRKKKKKKTASVHKKAADITASVIGSSQQKEKENGKKNEKRKKTVSVDETATTTTAPVNNENNKEKRKMASNVEDSVSDKNGKKKRRSRRLYLTSFEHDFF